MAKFQYIARDSAGQEQRGTIDANDRASAIQAIRASRGDTEYLKAIPNGDENDNLGNLPSVSPQSGG